LKREFIQHVRREYDLFMVRYSNVNRDASASHLGLQYEREAVQFRWFGGQKDQIIQEALWGPFMERIWEKSLFELEEIAKRL